MIQFTIFSPETRIILYGSGSRNHPLPRRAQRGSAAAGGFDPPPRVADRLDHLAVDEAGGRVFVAALGANRVVEITLRTRAVRTIGGFSKPQGIFYAADCGRLFVASGEDGVCRILHGRSLQVLRTVPLSKGADLLDYDADWKRLYVGHGGRDAGKDYGEVAVIDPASGLIGNIPMTAHPGAILVEQGGTRLFVTIPERDEIAVVDRRRNRVLERWHPEGAGQPVSLAGGDAGKLLVGIRRPPGLLVVDTDRGGAVARSGSVGLMDGLFFDVRTKRAYASGGEGFVAVHGPDGGMARVPVRAGARTSLWVPKWGRLLVALPAAEGRDAEVRVYEAVR